MTGPGGAHEMTDLAVLYALGSLSQHEARSFEEHLADGCDTCRAELESFELTVQSIGLSASEEPPARVRAALLASVSGKADQSNDMTSEATPPFLSILSSEGTWQELIDGVLVKSLFVDPDSGMATSLVRMLPGTSLPVHQHLGVEQFFVIEGDCNVAGQRLGPGDYHRAEKGSIHHSTNTVNGTLFLLIAPERYEILDSDNA
jgi:anti-sigma factor ChrR (cupin superfamily)